MQKWIDKLKEGKKDQILILLLLGVLLLVIAMPAEETDTGITENNEVSETQQVSQETQETQVQILEEKLRRILSRVEGIGEAEVMITVKSEGRKVVEKDVEHSEEREESTQEGDPNSSGQISDRESTVYERDAQGNEIPYVTEQLEPEIEGVLVIAQGAGNSSVAAEITEAVMALFGVEAHKIKVMKME